MNVNILREQCERCDSEIKSLVRLAADNLPQPAEERERFAEIVSQLEKDQKEIESMRNASKEKIKHYENRHWGFTGTTYSNGFGFLLNCLSFISAVSGLAQLTAEKLVPVEDDDDAKRGLGIGFAASVVIFGILFILGNTIHYLGRRAWQMRNRYVELTPEDKKDLKKFIDMFKEIVSINSESDEEILKHKFKVLLQDLPEIPKEYEGIRILRKRDDLISYTLLSLPKNHPVRQQLRNFAAPFDSSVPPSEQPEPEITTFPRQGPSDPYRSFVQKTIERKQLEGHLKNSSPDNLTPREDNYLKSEYDRCKKWIEIESYIGQGVPHLRIGNKMIPRESVFRVVDYDTFKYHHLGECEALAVRYSSSDSEFDIEAQQ